MGLSTKKVVRYNYFFIWVGLLCFTLSLSVLAHGSQTLNQTKLKTIVIDPGHGGKNGGVKGVDGTLEKDISLKLSQLVAKHLQPQYHVLLTRNEDHDLPIADRTALANHHKADLFISIHAGGAFRPDTVESVIMYYSPPKTDFMELEPKVTNLSNNQEYPPVKWENAQQDHIPASRTLAETLRAELKIRSSTTAPSISSAPLYVLAGADMPAIYIEPFYLTHPDTEEHLQSAENLKNIAADIAASITAALK